MHRPVLWRISAGLLAATVGVLVAASPTLASPARHGAPNHKVSYSTSSNWSGYALSGHGPYTSVSAHWTQPEVNCSVTPNGWSAFWVGLDGDTTSTVEQTGTEAECSSGKAVYFGWYEMYPRFPTNYRNRVAPGDSMSASVSYTGNGTFSLTLSDVTQRWSQSTSQRLTSAKLASAEVIVEAPSSSGGILPLADFGTATLGEAHADGSLVTSATPGIEPISMLAGATLLAEPSPIGEGTFSDTWHASGATPPSTGRGKHQR